MNTRERAIEAAKQAIADNVDGWDAERAHYPAVAAFDAILGVMEEPGFETKTAGAEAITADMMKAAANYNAAVEGWSAMLTAIKEGK